MTSETLKQDSLAPIAQPWSGVFNMRDLVKHQTVFMINELTVNRDDVLTAKLSQTVRFYRAVEAKAFPVLPNSIGSLNAVLDIFCTLSTFDNLARSGFASPCKPAFWIRVGEKRRVLAPVLPLSMAAKLCGVSEALLRASLVPLVKDGALELLRSPDGAAGILVKTGFINDISFRRHYKS